MSAPIKNTCPDIDSVIKRIDAAIKLANHGMKDNEKGSDNYELFYEIENELWGQDGAMEDLREANTTLREYGDDMEKERDEAIKELDEFMAKYEESQTYKTS